MIEVKLSFQSYEEALEVMVKLSGKAVAQEIKPTHEHAKPKKEKPVPKVEPKPGPTPEPVVGQPAEAPDTEMPAPPVFDNPVPEPKVDTASNVPFNDGKGMIAYVMASYKELGAQKGAGIQQVLSGLGYSNINDVSPDHYAALYQGIEDLKG